MCIESPLSDGKEKESDKSLQRAKRRKIVLWENFLQACAFSQESESKEFSNSNRQPNDDYK